MDTKSELLATATRLHCHAVCAESAAKAAYFATFAADENAACMISDIFDGSLMNYQNSLRTALAELSHAVTIAAAALAACRRD